jgi:hypothetical protein
MCVQLIAKVTKLFKIILFQFGVVLSGAAKRGWEFVYISAFSHFAKSFVFCVNVI